MVDTTDQVPGVGGGAPRCYPQGPAIAPASRQLVARLRRRIQRDTQYIHSVQSSHGTLAGSPPPGSASYETHSRTRVGGWVLRSGCALIGVVRGRHHTPLYNFVRQRVKKLGKVFISTPEDTGPAYTQMKLQHRSRAPGHTPLIV